MQKYLFTIKLAGKPIRVITDTEVDPYAIFATDTQTIHLHPTVIEDKELYISTLRHELMHALIYVTGVYPLISEEMQEVLIRLMDSFFYDAVETTTKQVESLLEKEATKASQ